MDIMELEPGESSETKEAPERTEAQKLEDATLEPRAFVEQAGDYRQAEAIQDSLIAVVDNAASQTNENSCVLPLPTPAGESGNKEVAGDIPIPIPRSVEEISMDPGQETMPKNEDTPINLSDLQVTADEPLQGPQPFPEATASVGSGRPGGDVAATTNNIPNPVENTLEVATGILAGEETMGAIHPHLPEQVDTRQLEKASEEGGVGGEQAIPINIPGVQSMAEPRGAHPESLHQHAHDIEGGGSTMGDWIGHGTAGASLDASKGIGLNKEALGEAEETWIPPEMYKYVGTDGKITVVDANGKPIDCPPIVSSTEGHYFYAYYPGMVDKDGEPVTFEIEDFKGSLDGLYLYMDSSGKQIVVDANGKPVDSPPVVVSPDGMSWFATYPGSYSINDLMGGEVPYSALDDVVELQVYKGSLGDLYLYVDGSGKQIVVDANGKPVDSPPAVTSVDGTTFYASYGGGYQTGDAVELQVYKGSLDGLYLGTDSNGKQIVVDAYGKAVDSPPIISSTEGHYFYAYYPGMVDKDGEQITVDIQYYKGSLNGLYLYVDSSGKQIVVDANGKPVDSPPVVVSPDGQKFMATYPGSTPMGDWMADEWAEAMGKVVELQVYKGSLDDLYLYVDSSGKQIVVDANGKPVDSPPTVTSPDGTSWFASYAGGSQTGNMVQLQYYKPPSAKPA